jgi:NAD(P)-dependent dehydrogenase (short-subunit alcohol dehydrogenase family)
MASRIIAITGATRGLGRALVDGFSKLGHQVIGCGRSSEDIEQLRREPGPAEAFAVVDVASDPAVRSWAEAFLARFGPPDLLINNAAVINRDAPLWEVTAEEFDLVVDVNLKGVANVIRHVVPAMIERGSGVIVNLSSGWGRSTSPEVAPYCTTKWGIEGLTRSLAQELPRGMAAVPLNPGIIDTDMLRSTFGGGASHYPNADQWAKGAVPFLLALGPNDNGKPLTAPG